MTEYKPVFTLLLPEIMLTNDDSPSLLEKTKEIKGIPYYKALKLLM